jgi:hypothetical protein
VSTVSATERFAAVRALHLIDAAREEREFAEVWQGERAQDDEVRAWVWGGGGGVPTRRAEVR